PSRAYVHECTERQKRKQVATSIVASSENGPLFTQPCPLTLAGRLRRAKPVVPALFPGLTAAGSGDGPWRRRRGCRSGRGGWLRGRAWTGQRRRDVARCQRG